MNIRFRKNGCLMVRVAGAYSIILKFKHRFSRHYKTHTLKMGQAEKFIILFPSQGIFTFLYCPMASNNTSRSRFFFSFTSIDFSVILISPLLDINSEPLVLAPAISGSTLKERNEADQAAHLGITTSNTDQRVSCSLGKGGHAAIQFEHNPSVCQAGLLFMLPAFLSQGLLKTKEVYQLPSSHYYGLESVVLTLAFMALARIKNPEQLKQCKPGELSRIIGLDRIPEVRCLREKINLLTQQGKASELNNLLMEAWYIIDEESNEDTLVEQREQIPARIKLKNMPEQICYNKLKTESKMLLIIIKMISYRAESAVASLVTPYLARAEEEKRMFFKQIINNNADLIPDYEKNILSVVLHSLSTPRFNRAASMLAQLLNETQTIFPGTNLRLSSKLPHIQFAKGKECRNYTQMTGTTGVI